MADAMLKDVDLTRFVVNLLPSTLDENLRPKVGFSVHRTLLAFNLATLLEYLSHAKEDTLDAGLLAFLLPALLSPLQLADSDGSDKTSRNPITPILKKDSIVSDVPFAFIMH